MFSRAPSYIFVLLALFTYLSKQDTKDPVKDFCRRFGHQTAVIDRRLYIDGGQINWNPISQNPLNYTNTWLSYQDLDVTNQGMPQLHANLSKNSSVPDVSGGVLWADEVNKVLYLYGGEFQSSPEDFTLWAYDVILDQWNRSTADTSHIQRVSRGAGVAINDRAEGYYLGGWLSNLTVPGWSGPPVATSNLIKYDMIGNVFTNNSGPDTTGRAEGVMVYLPASDRGLLVYFGGILDPYKNGTTVGNKGEHPVAVSPAELPANRSSVAYTDPKTLDSYGTQVQNSGGTYSSAHTTSPLPSPHPASPVLVQHPSSPQQFYGQPAPQGPYFVLPTHDQQMAGFYSAQPQPQHFQPPPPPQSHSQNPPYDPTQDPSRQHNYPPPPDQSGHLAPHDGGHYHPAPSPSNYSDEFPSTKSTPAQFYPQPLNVTGRQMSHEMPLVRSPQPVSGKFIEEED
ncbi:hypothetical protein BJ546DRAFT_1059827 [Cryomyces antarcticus]|uniref:Uncharacterized protein n=1 Tax=Cryomyces antarcticus TaxID=329879 RepID=A0ABR0KTN2_9PEZI|nr:hypothetical protein LTR16_001819 [Cryomyces antarcticus]